MYIQIDRYKDIYIYIYSYTHIYACINIYVYIYTYMFLIGNDGPVQDPVLTQPD